ncbi:carbon-nitrogen hydrolase family protein [Paenibacillus sp. BC26]|uniref:carbon-nitrogen hydrolase family protein n=1 Tax=Paenibacillus sp. BC26 TaxID=1881032 RepID=UPI0015A655EA|nr:carbon-nitrogen hydrolase family protein [Paenibacillus sp. BC26]
MKIRIGMGQMRVVPGDVEANMNRAIDMIHKAKGNGCQIVVLPECLDYGWTYPGAKELAQPIPGPLSDRLAEEARKTGLYIAAGLTEKEGKYLYNASVLLSPTGDILIKHRKINEVPFARELYRRGDKLETVSTPLGRIGLNICADNWPSSLSLGHSLGLMGAQILLSPCAWAVTPQDLAVRKPYGEEWRSAYSTLALTHGMAVIGTSNVGPVIGGAWDGWSCIGSSLAVDAGGNVIAKAEYGEDAEQLLAFDLAVELD